MYEQYFGLNEAPFSISPDTQYLYLSESHRDAIAHLIYALNERGGFVQLTGEVGTGKTMVCRHIISNLPANIELALILNPRVDELGLVRALCDELRIVYAPTDDLSLLLRKLNLELVKTHAQGRHTLLFIDEAQNLPPATLELIRLLTNLETTKQKLLRIVLVGQPELAELLAKREMRQVAQRITGRFELKALSKDETYAYIAHRVQIAGCMRPIFAQSAMQAVYKLTQGTPRLINVLCDHSLMAAYSLNLLQVDAATVHKASVDALPPNVKNQSRKSYWPIAASVALALGFGATTEQGQDATDWVKAQFDLSGTAELVGLSTEVNRGKTLFENDLNLRLGIPVKVDDQNN